MTDVVRMPVQSSSSRSQSPANVVLLGDPGGEVRAGMYCSSPFARKKKGEELES